MWLTEELTRRFYAWEMRGRGLLQWGECVRLEPPFRPFPGHFAARPEPRDDGRMQTSVSTFLDRLLGREEPTPPALPRHEEEETEPEYAEESGDLVEFALALPEGTKLDREAAEAFLLSLRGRREPIAFELVATAERITVQCATRREDASLVTEELRAFFPAASVAESSGYLEHVWSASPGRVAIIECALAREFMLPLRTFLRADPDPLIATIGALGNLTGDEVAVLQVLFEPVREDWASSVRRATTDGEGGAFFVDAPELTKLAWEKVTHPLFATVIRLATSSPTSGRAALLLRQLAGTLGHFGREDGNDLTVAPNERDVDLESDLLSRTSHRSGMLLSSGELVGLVHPPSASVVSPKLLRRVRRTKAAPRSSVGQPIALGVNEHAGETMTVGLSAEERMRHMHVIGASGTGKSTFLLDLILQSVAQGRGVGVLDPHGDLIDEVLGRIPDGRAKDVIFLDAADAAHPVGLNVLDAHSELEATLLASDLVGIFRRLSTTWGDQMQAVLANAIQAFLTSKEGGTLHDLRRFLIESDYRRKFLGTVEDEEVVYYWTKEFPLLVGKPAGPILTRLDGFLRPKPLRAMFGQRESRLDFREIMDRSRIFLAKLAQGAVGAENAALLGSLLVAKFHQAALSRQELAREARRDFDLVIDEFQDLVTPSVAGILSGTRKYRLGLTAAHQSLRPVYEADAAVASALLANAATRVVFRVGEDDAKKLADGFASFDAQALTSLGVGEAICRIDRADHNFNVRTRVPAAVDAATATVRRQRIAALSHERYAAPPAVSDPAAATPREAPSLPIKPPLAKPTRGRQRNQSPGDELRKLLRDVAKTDEQPDE
ncbi:MAG TPA: type IV secretion system DNA-binding domain-containing protein [Thermoanaerobaculia bacterium]|nr:type IV secretion system DNA-binding domain-containing protein [Thermoanaerobaculia bacterium]